MSLTLDVNLREGSLAVLAQADGTSALPAAEHIQNFVALVIPKSRGQTRRVFENAKRNCLCARRAANLVPDTQRTINNRRACAHLGNAATAFQLYCHSVSLYQLEKGEDSFCSAPTSRRFRKR